MFHKEQIYKSIITELVGYFAEMYKYPYFKRIYNSKLSTEVAINCGDCYCMALLVEQIAKQKGLTPVIYSGGWHVFIVDDGKIYDSYFPDGITFADVANMRVNVKTQDDDPNEPVFYQGGPITKHGDLQGYFRNTPNRGIFVEYILSLYRLRVPDGLRYHVNMRHVWETIPKRKLCMAYKRKYRKQTTGLYAMKRFIKHLRKVNEKAGVHFS